MSSTVPCAAPAFSDQRRSRSHQWLLLLELCCETKELSQLHSTLVKLSLIRNPHFSARLSLSLSTIDLSYARQLFDQNPDPNAFAYNILIKAYSKTHRPIEALTLFSHMLDEDSPKPNKMTFPFVLKSCSVETGRQVHAALFKYGLETDVYVNNALISMYMKAGSCFRNAMKVFDRMPQRDVVTWNTVIAGLASLGLVKEARDMFDAMPERNVASWNCLIDGYFKQGLIELARELFDRAPVKDVITWNTMVNGYASLDRMEEGRDLFDRMPMGLKDLTSFNLVIDGYSRNEGFEKVLEIFHEMRGLEICPDRFTLVSVLSACSNLSALEQGKWVHLYVKRLNIKLDAVLTTALIDMYAKCGNMERALDVFVHTEKKDISVWNSVISNLGLHGYGKEALEFFFQLLETDVCPDEITFLSILTACRHSGLVEEGRMYFDLMSRKYDITPKAKHYGCMVDILCRAGLLDEAKALIEAHSGEEFSVATWGALLDAASRLGNVEMGEYAAKPLLELDPKDTRCYVALSNLYSRGKEWDESAEVRKQMRRRGMEKLPGCSSIEVNGVVHEFQVGSAFNTLDEIV
ncbi:pentatricopeptide repeat-containing protein-like [Iris pallida]|uniref:Pentatricopeptide repeat-containing protein-like n=1 Tax=Iris pallida TaxID=29817 RepID=A0AAX6F232_IRIPA|nr:pentatricopeptide repeat-containing protein-like [Iris pallida]